MVAKIARSPGERRRNAIKISRKEISRPSRSIRVEILICPNLGEEKLARGEGESTKVVVAVIGEIGERSGNYLTVEVRLRYYSNYGGINP